MADTNDIFSRCRASLFNGYEGTPKAFGKERPAPLTRYMGGRNRLNHPYITGYWQFYIDVPTLIFGSDTKLGSQEWLHSVAEGFTPPTRTLNKADVPGQGGLGSSFITGQTLTRTFTVTFREYQDLPIYGIMELWTSILDPYVGVSPLKGNQWLPPAYKGVAMAALVKPTMENDKISAKDIEQVFFFHGVWPETSPTDTLSQDISANDVLQHNITFSFDGWPLTKSSPGVVNKAVEMLDGSQYYKTTYVQYLSDINSEAYTSPSDE